MSEKAEQLAQQFHEAYERLAPDYGYSTRKASAVSWSDVPDSNKALMIAVAGEILASQTAHDAEVRAEERERLAAPGDPDARMDAYYYSFERTGVGIIDGILSAVATAGKRYHNTDMWTDDEQGPSNADMIQEAANAAAAAIRAVSENAALTTKEN